MLKCHFWFSVQVKAQMMLLEAQLEKQADNMGASEEMEQVCTLSVYLELAARL